MQEKINLLESLIFMAGEEISKQEIMAGMFLTELELEEMLGKLKEKYSGGIVIKEFGDSIAFATAKSVSSELEAILNPIKERKFSASVMETLAIIAYKQPITRVEMENVRGVSCDWAISQLLKDGIVEITGRKDVIGRPQQFGTTTEFLKKFGLKSISDLPDYSIIKSKIKKDMENSMNQNTFFLQEETQVEELLEVQEVGRG